MSVIAGVVVALLVAVGLWYFYPEETERWLVRLLTAKRIVFGIGAIILGLFLLSTGALGLMLIGGAVLVFAALYFLNDPDGYIDQYV